MRFGIFLGRLRQNAGFSQKQLAKALGWDQSYLSRIENGQRKAPSRATLLSVARVMNLSEEKTDELLLSAQYQPRSLFEMDIEENDVSLKKHIGVLQDIRGKIPLSSYVRAQEDIADFLDLMRIKYLQKGDEDVLKNTLLADLVYAKVKRGGLKALYETVNQPQGGAVVIEGDHILLAPIGISPLKNIWHIPAGFVNPKRGDRNAKDIAVRLVKWYIGDAKLEVVRELTAEGEVLEGIDTTDYSIKLGFFPAVFQAFEIKLRDKNHILSGGAKFFKFQDIPNIQQGVHPLLSRVIRPFVKDSKIVSLVYKKGEATIDAIIQHKNYRQDLKRFYEERIKKNAL